MLQSSNESIFPAQCKMWWGVQKPQQEIPLVQNAFFLPIPLANARRKPNEKDKVKLTKSHRIEAYIAQALQQPNNY